MNATPTALRSSDLYRLPWNLSDNGISWLEPTVLCNLRCDGCYRKITAPPHKPLEQVKAELDVFERYRKTDCISVAGGEPLLYPDIVELVEEIRSRGLKPIINSNGEALTPQLLERLKRAGVFGFTFHVDSRQRRSGSWEGKNELELNELRLRYADMLAEAGDVACSFNATVYAENLQYVPGMIEWAAQHIDRVQTMVFICFRHVIPEMPFDWFVGGQAVRRDEIWYHSDEGRDVEIRSEQLLAKARERFPEFTPAAYLNGTQDAGALKWLLTERVGTRERIYGYVGPKFVELASSAYHLLKGRYLSYVSPRTARAGRLAMLALWPVDRGLRRAARSFLGSAARNPLRLLRRAHLQSVMFIQPIDFLAGGEQSMCDGCPDITVHEGKLVWSCRLEELKEFGRFIDSAPRRI